MYLSKFFVSILLVLQFSIHTIAGQWNYANIDRDFDHINIINTTDVLLRELNPLTSTSIRLDRWQGKQNATENENENENEFKFLITGGYRPETNHLVKFMVSLQEKKENMLIGEEHFCAGSIISTKTILTAAHCCISPELRYFRPDELIVVAGTQRRLLSTENTQILELDMIIPNPKFTFDTLVKDVGILKLKDELKLIEGFVEIIPMADSAPQIDTKCTTVGWGRVIQFGPMPDDVLNAELIIRNASECATLVPPIPKGAICARNDKFQTECCNGDSGGPVFCNDKLAGIVSYGDGCGRSSKGGVYTDVYYHREWIAMNAANDISRSIDRLMLLLLAILKLAINS